MSVVDFVVGGCCFECLLLFLSLLVLMFLFGGSGDGVCC